MSIFLVFSAFFSVNTFAALPMKQVLNDVVARSNGLLSKNLSVLEQPVLTPLTHETILNKGSLLLMGDLEFSFDAAKNIYSPTVISDAEQVQALFTFDEEKFVQNQNAKDFLEAKWNYYRSLKYDFKLKTYLHPAPRLSDWMALNHPPIRSLSHDIQFYSKKSGSPKVESSIRNTIEFQNKMDSLSTSELTVGNDVQLLNNGNVSQSRLEIAKSAQKTFWGSSLLMVCDSGTQPLIDIMAEKVKQGVDVRIMLDHFMQTMQKGNCVETLRGLGIQVLLVKGMISHLSAFHMKMWIADLDRAQIEGMNMIDAQTLSTGFNHLYRDSGLSFQGPIVTDTYAKYMELWNHYSGSPMPEIYNSVLLVKKTQENALQLRGSKNYSEWLNKKPAGSLCRLVTQDRKTDSDRISPVYLEYLKSAKDQIIATSVRRGFSGVSNERGWHNQLLAELVRKARDENVQVDLMVNTDQNVFSIYDIPNSGMNAASRKNIVTSLMRVQRNYSRDRSIKTGEEFFGDIAEQTEKFRAWSYMDFSHLKVTMIDRDTFISGSYNPFTPRSDHDAELVVICQDPKLAELATEQLTLDLSNSTPFPRRSNQ